MMVASLLSSSDIMITSSSSFGLGSDSASLRVLLAENLFGQEAKPLFGVKP
jgi:hypothetical protein